MHNNLSLLINKKKLNFKYDLIQKDYFKWGLKHILDYPKLDLKPRAIDSFL